MLWIALHFDRLSLDVIERSYYGALANVSAGPHNAASRADPGATTGVTPLVDPVQRPLPALAICDHVQILNANFAASEQGVRPGMKRATAQALLPGIQLVDHDPVREQHAMTALACWALQFTPATAFAPPALPTARGLQRQTRHKPETSQAPLPRPGQAGLLLDVEASLRYFGGLPRLLTTMHADLQQLGYHATCAVAPTPGAAWLLARHQCHDALAVSREPDSHDPDALAARLAGVPVALLMQAGKHIPALHAIGAHTIGDLLELPRAGLARRFGKQLLLEVDCALGHNAQPLASFQAPQQFVSKMELMADVEQADALLAAATRLLVELTGWLRARQAAVRHFDLLAFHDETPPTAITVRLADPSRHPERLVGLLRERLNVLQLRAPVHTIELRCDQVHEQATSSGELFASPASHRENLGRLLERLQTRLGREQVQRLYLAEDHRPESAYQVQVIDDLEQLGTSSRHPAQTADNDDQLPAPVTNETGSLPRPLWLLREAQPLRERNNRPWLNSTLNVVAGPERIETGWWDTNLVQRDYFVAEDDTHTLYWIYRERQAGHDRSGWYVQGRFG